MAIKDEYEVARLFTNGDFAAQLDANFEGDYRIHFHMAPPLLAKRDPVSGRQQKREFGPWLMPVLRMIARLRRLRGTPLDIFRYSKDRQLDRQELVDYESALDLIAENLNEENYSAAVELAGLATTVRGFGPVKEKARENVAEQRAALGRQLRG